MKLWMPLALVVALPLLVQAEDLLTESELEAAFLAAQRDLAQEQVAAMPVEQVRQAPPQIVEEIDVRRKNSAQVELVQNPEIAINGNTLPQVDLSRLRVSVNYEDVTLAEAVRTIVADAEDQVGPWDVKFRLTPDNQHLLAEHVTLTAETTLGQFLNLLTERVNNMTGVQLFVNVFDANRMILISDSFF